MMAKPIRDLELHYPMIQLLIITVNTLSSITSHSLGNEAALKRRGHVTAVRKTSHQWGVFLTPNNTKTIGRMTCHCFLRPIRTDLPSSSYTSQDRTRESGSVKIFLRFWLLTLLKQGFFSHVFLRHLFLVVWEHITLPLKRHGFCWIRIT